MRRGRMCCSSWTTSSVSRRLDRRCRHSSAVSQAPSATSRPWPRTWHRCRSASPRPRRGRSPRCRPSTCPRTISPIRPPPRPSPTWMPRRCCQGRLRSSASTRRWILWTPPPVCLTPPSWDSDTTTLHAAPRRSSRTTSPCRISLPFWVWMSSPRRTSSQLHGPGKCSASSRSPSSWLRSSPGRPAPLWTLRQRSTTSKRFCRAPVMTSPRLHST
mmetsp:Transcript_71046/g.161378  ORF Transcript_71046/g.161378 Transcript_71046/m.161378 type:complete len:215 (+) Transcript_71046:917-1561(+)